MRTGNNQIIVFLIITTALIVLLLASIVTILYLYQKKRISFQEHLTLSQLEIQEETFQNISREIHDNIGLSLTLAKLHLNSLSLNRGHNSNTLIDTSIELISQAINDLSDISKNLNSDAICQHGLLNVLAIKIDKLKKSGSFTIDFNIEGEPVFLHSQKELILYRIFQEALNNIIKHSKATTVEIYLNFMHTYLELKIKDDGIGINYEEIQKSKSQKIMTGLTNIKKRAKMLNGSCNILSDELGTTIYITVPLDKNEK